MASLFTGNRDEDMFRAYILVFEPGRLGEGRIDDTLQSLGYISLIRASSGNTGHSVEGPVNLMFQLLCIGAKLFYDFGYNPLGLPYEDTQHMFHINTLVTVAICQRFGLLKGLLEFYCKFIKPHRSILFYNLLDMHEYLTLFKYPHITRRF